MVHSICSFRPYLVQMKKLSNHAMTANFKCFHFTPSVSEGEMKPNLLLLHLEDKRTGSILDLYLTEGSSSCWCLCLIIEGSSAANIYAGTLCYRHALCAGTHPMAHMKH